jgi:hypothetical protein
MTDDKACRRGKSEFGKKTAPVREVKTGAAFEAITERR